MSHYGCIQINAIFIIINQMLKFAGKTLLMWYLNESISEFMSEESICSKKFNIGSTCSKVQIIFCSNYFYYFRAEYFSGSVPLFSKYCGKWILLCKQKKTCSFWCFSTCIRIWFRRLFITYLIIVIIYCNLINMK